MTERPEDASYGLILIQGTLQDSLPPRCHSLTSASSCYGSTLGSSACLVTSLRCVCSLLRSASRVFSCRRWHSGTLFSVPQYWRKFRSEEHTSELQSLTNLVCRLLLEKKKKQTNKSV